MKFSWTETKKNQTEWDMLSTDEQTPKYAVLSKHYIINVRERVCARAENGVWFIKNFAERMSKE